MDGIEKTVVSPPNQTVPNKVGRSRKSFVSAKQIAPRVRPAGFLTPTAAVNAADVLEASKLMTIWWLIHVVGFERTLAPARVVSLPNIKDKVYLTIVLKKPGLNSLNILPVSTEHLMKSYVVRHFYQIVSD